MNELTLRDWIWIALLGGGAALLLGRYLVRAVRRGRCAGCDDAGCGARATGRLPEEGCHPLSLHLEGEGEPEPPRRRNGRHGSASRRFHKVVAALTLPLLVLLLASGAGLLFREELGLAHRPLPARLALALYGAPAGPVVALATGRDGRAVAAADGVIATRGDGWHGVTADRPLGAVHDVAWLPGGRLAAATDRGVWLSAEGRRWDYLADGAAGLPSPVTRLVVAAGRVWAATPLGPYRSDDGGVSWHAATGPAPAALAAPPARGPAPAGAAAAWLAARGWPSWERLTIDLHGGHLFGGRWRAAVMLTWLALVALAVSGPLVARSRRRHRRSRTARQPAPRPPLTSPPGAPRTAA